MTYKILNEKGEVEAQGPCHSWVKGMLQLICALMKNSHTDQITDTANSAFTWAAFNTGYYKLYVNAAAGVVAYGIVAGTGIGANSPTDYKIGTLIDQGTTSGKFQYGSHSFIEPVVSGTDIQLVINRLITNASGGDITINEVAMYARDDQGTTTKYVCLMREKLSSGVTVSNGANKTIQLTLTESNVLA